MAEQIEQAGHKLHPISWVTVRSLLSIPAVRWVGLFPFVGYLILYNDKIIEFLQARYPSVPFQSLDYFNLHCTFFGLLLLGISSFVYQIFAPNEVRVYANITEFITEALRTITPRGLNRYVEDFTDLCTDEKIREHIRQKYTEADRIELRSPGTFDETVNMKWSAWIEECMYPITDILTMHYIVRANRRFRRACYICFLTGLLGYMIMFIPTMRIILKIIAPLATPLCVLFPCLR